MLGPNILALRGRRTTALPDKGCQQLDEVDWRVGSGEIARSRAMQATVYARRVSLNVIRSGALKPMKASQRQADYLQHAVGQQRFWQQCSSLSGADERGHKFISRQLKNTTFNPQKVNSA